mmetsp:Transcript_27575/g.26609  ORF Transcript_27575/g.26609 Transcript_27575/m.26609 type:complete len:87 (-) Transcript_27575:350-610(-)
MPPLNTLQGRIDLFAPKTKHILEFDPKDIKRKPVFPIEFKKQTLRKPLDNIKPFQMPFFHDEEKIEEGIKSLSTYKRAKGVHQIDK